MSRHRGCTVGSMMKNIIKARNEANNGRLNIYPNGYEFGTVGCTNRQGVHLGPSKDDNERSIQLTLGVRTVANCPKPPGDYPQVHGSYWVPLKECRKCSFFLKRPTRGRNYLACQALRDLRKDSPSGGLVALQMLGQATKQANEIVGGSIGG